MVRLTADLIYKCPQYFNAVRERELDLRGNKIAVIENLGATEDQFDSIDLSDNEIVKLENFPYLKRLTTLLLNNSRIARVNPNVGEFLPNLQTLILTNNRLVNLADLDPLASLNKLQTLSLLDNIVTKKSNYRLYVIHKLKKLRLLDFRKVKQKERLEAEKYFASKEAEEDAKKEPVKTFTPGEVPTVTETPMEQVLPKAVPPTPEQILAIKAAIANSQTLEEVARLEKALKSGQLPADLKIPDDDMKTEPMSTEHAEKTTEDQNRIPQNQNEGTEKTVETTERSDTDHPMETSENPTENMEKPLENADNIVEKNEDTVMEEV
uniref:U2A'/phosphoprotein 32 family A C-terminal domain-containing protein n=1 Tax=Araucaria cunninghamii TaxID=56994 RepID=A0A0D6RAZ8_ARACU